MKVSGYMTKWYMFARYMVTQPPHQLKKLASVMGLSNHIQSLTVIIYHI